jgi:HlyD family secretion protein
MSSKDGWLMTSRRFRRWKKVLRIAAVLVVLGVAGWAFDRLRPKGRPAYESWAMDTVHREDVDIVLTVGGEIKGEKQTEIECELKNLPSTTNYGSMSGQTILKLIPDGSKVKKGDMLCQFDESAYREMERQQEIEVQRGQAELRVAELDFDSAKLALRSFRDGEVMQQSNALEGQIILMRADLQRTRQRLQWTERMREIRYVSSSDVANQKHTLLSMEEGLKQAEGNFNVYRKYTVPKIFRDLESQIQASDERLAFAKLQHKNQEKRLAKIRKQIESCTIRAPHDGLVIHADVMYGPELKLREGMQVHEGQPLFFLPDLDHLAAAVSLHESIAARVKVGMPARIRIPAFPDRIFTGRVQFIEQLPSWNWRAGMDITHFAALIKIDQAPKGILPDMSAEVQIITGRREDALVVRSEALTLEDGRQYCYVAKGPDLERRPVRLGRADRNLLEVLDGLHEGEDVVLHPSGFQDEPIEALPETRPRRVETAAEIEDPLEALIRPS